MLSQVQPRDAMVELRWELLHCNLIGLTEDEADLSAPPHANSVRWMICHFTWCVGAGSQCAR